MASTYFSGARRIYSGDAITQATGVTITGWAKFTSFSPWGAALCFGDIILGAASASPNHVELDYLSGGKTDSGYSASTSAWFFFAITWSGSTVTIKISSDFATITHSQSTTKASTWSMSSFEVGDYQNSNERYNGQIHHLRVFNDVLSDSEILAEMASTIAAQSAWAAWELNDANLNDQSGNGRNLSGSGGTVTAGSESAPVPEGGAEEGAASVALELAVAAVGASVAAGAAATSLGLAVSAGGAKTAAGAASVPMVLALAATGTAVRGAAAGVPASLGVVAAGAAMAAGAAAIGISLEMAARAEGQTVASGAASVTLGLSVACSGTAVTAATASIPLALAAEASGTAIQGTSASFDLGLSALAAGSSVATGAVSCEFSLSCEVAGEGLNTAGSAAFEISLTATCVGASVAAAVAAFELSMAMTAGGSTVPPPESPTVLQWTKGDAPVAGSWTPAPRPRVTWTKLVHELPMAA